MTHYREGMDNHGFVLECFRGAFKQKFTKEKSEHTSKITFNSD